MNYSSTQGDSNAKEKFGALILNDESLDIFVPNDVYGSTPSTSPLGTPPSGGKGCARELNAFLARTATPAEILPRQGHSQVSLLLDDAKEMPCDSPLDADLQQFLLFAGENYSFGADGAVDAQSPPLQSEADSATETPLFVKNVSPERLFYENYSSELPQSMHRSHSVDVMSSRNFDDFVGKAAEEVKREYGTPPPPRGPVARTTSRSVILFDLRKLNNVNPELRPASESDKGVPSAPVILDGFVAVKRFDDDVQMNRECTECTPPRSVVSEVRPTTVAVPSFRLVEEGEEIHDDNDDDGMIGGGAHEYARFRDNRGKIVQKLITHGALICRVGEEQHVEAIKANFQSFEAPLGKRKVKPTQKYSDGGFAPMMRDLQPKKIPQAEKRKLVSLPRDAKRAKKNREVATKKTTTTTTTTKAAAVAKVKAPMTAEGQIRIPCGQLVEGEDRYRMFSATKEMLEVYSKILAEYTEFNDAIYQQKKTGARGETEDDYAFPFVLSGDGRHGNPSTAHAPSSIKLVRILRDAAMQHAKELLQTFRSEILPKAVAMRFGRVVTRGTEAEAHVDTKNRQEIYGRGEIPIGVVLNAHEKPFHARVGSHAFLVPPSTVLVYDKRFLSTMHKAYEGKHVQPMDPTSFQNVVNRRDNSCLKRDAARRFETAIVFNTQDDAVESGGGARALSEDTLKEVFANQAVPYNDWLMYTEKYCNTKVPNPLPQCAWFPENSASKPQVLRSHWVENALKKGTFKLTGKKNPVLPKRGACKSLRQMERMQPKCSKADQEMFSWQPFTL